MKPRGPARFFGYGLPYADTDKLGGLLITVEGTDGVGRSTQVRLLREWLEVQGYGVIETGWTRSELMSETIGAAKAGHALNRLTFSLLYATDFADRLEKIILPALKSGFIVLADRYIFTAFARSIVRGADPAWIRSVFGFAVVPDLTLYLRIKVDPLFPRLLRNRDIDYWEAGMDMHLGVDLFESFRTYQTRLIQQYDSMSKEFGFVEVDANKDIDWIQERMRASVMDLLSRKGGKEAPDERSPGAPLVFPAEPKEAPKDSVSEPAGGEADRATSGGTPRP